MVVGHRGMGGNLGRTAPENSLAAIRAAIVAGVDGVEIDVRHSADDVLVVIHDDTVDRTLEGTGSVDELTLAELQALPMRTTAALVPEYPGDFSCERLPTFDEVLELARGRLFLDVDVKTGRAADVARAIRDADMLEHAFFSSGSLSKVVAAREAVPELAIQVRPDSAEAVEEWVAAFARPPEVFEMDWGDLEPALERIRGLSAKTFMDAFLQDVEALQEHFSGYADVWAQGVDIVQTDTPLVLLHSLGRGP